MLICYSEVFAIYSIFKVGLAEKTAVLFTKDGDQHNNLHDMQCMWCALVTFFHFWIIVCKCLWLFSLLILFACALTSEKVWTCFWWKLLSTRWPWKGFEKILGCWEALCGYDWGSIRLPFLLLTKNDSACLCGNAEISRSITFTCILPQSSSWSYKVPLLNLCYWSLFKVVLRTFVALLHQFL